jgi:hypothetical protein
MTQARYDKIAERFPGYKEVPAVLVVRCRK